MATTGINGYGEGQSTTRPPLFDGNNYAWWKTRMRIYLISIDYNLWEIVFNGPLIPTKIVDNKDIPKEEKKINDEDKKKFSINAKAMNCLFCVLCPNEFNQISACNSAKEIWDMLKVTHEGTNQVKESKISMLVHNYKLFKMDANETISEMFTRFTNIVNVLKGLGKSYTTSENVRKILRSLPKSWEAKVTGIQEAKDLSKLPLEELVGSLMRHEIIMKANVEEDVKKKKNLELKSTQVQEDSETEAELNDEEFAYLNKKFKKHFRKRNFSKKVNNQEGKGEKSNRDTIICYECKKPGHVNWDYPQRKAISKKSRKAMKATLDESDESEFESEEGVANLCVMAFRDDDDDDDEVSPENLTFD
ncbi:uncharacterized protein LOC120084093 [Benincasa hispida]|uniref:uncharacterized protein LOC120084093 n=1 Tax=Benincasa hispida TaxID=102211 RepID=UPI001900490B|nr:uncharacterized protein LOC120084093 [Benincasa hispida]